MNIIDDEPRKKRARTPNYTAQEKNVLLNIIHSKFKKIIENKKTDAITSKEKDAAWKNISTIFNSQSPTMILRTWDSLKKCYENLKKVTRKAVADERLEIMKTGGGVGVFPVHNPNHELTLSLMNAKTVHGLDNPVDPDGTLLPSILDDDESEVEQENDHPARTSSLSSQNQKRSLPSGSTYNTVDSDDEDPTEVQKENVHPRTPLTKRRKQETWTMRRRPVMAVANSKTLSDEYTELAKIKIEIANHTLQSLKREEERKEEEAALRIQFLKEDNYRKEQLYKLDFEIKQLELKKLKY